MPAFIKNSQTSQKPAKRPLPSRSGEEGWNLLSVTISMSCLLIAILGTIGSITSSDMLAASTKETTFAMNAARQAIDSLIAWPDISEVFKDHNESTEDDSPNAEGPNFRIFGLSPQCQDPDGMVGKFIFPEIGGALREDINNPVLGMPRDLNGDGVIDSDDHSDDFVILPVLVRIEWKGRKGDRNFELMTFIAERH